MVEAWGPNGRLGVARVWPTAYLFSGMVEAWGPNGRPRFFVVFSGMARFAVVGVDGSALVIAAPFLEGIVFAGPRVLSVN